MSLLPSQYGASGAPSSWAHENTGLGHKKRVFTLRSTKVPRIKWGTFKVPPISCHNFRERRNKLGLIGIPLYRRMQPMEH
jgi:hypothetical protein